MLQLISAFKKVKPVGKRWRRSLHRDVERRFWESWWRNRSSSGLGWTWTRCRPGRSRRSTWPSRQRFEPAVVGRAWFVEAAPWGSKSTGNGL